MEVEAIKHLTILGSTGSIGVSTLEVVHLHPERFSVFALSAARQTDVLLEQCLRFKPQFAVMVDATCGADLAFRLKTHGSSTRVLIGPQALCEVAAHPDCDYVMAAIVGAAGLAPCIAAAQAGKRILLANKEALVVGGELFLHAVQAGGAKILPVDSEHSAIFQALPSDSSTWHTSVDKIILTASGGPFRSFRPEDLSTVTPEQACAHPNWVMGQKISVDSATMMNKALEVIEAKHLFGLAPEQIEVLIHPQSVVHSMVQYRDGSVIAQLGTPDMRGPIAYALSWPQRIETGAQRLDFTTMGALTFDKPNAALFPCLDLAWQVLKMPSSAAVVLNAANEVAVQAFLNRQIRFDQIYRINEGMINEAARYRYSVENLEQLIEIDKVSRGLTSNLIDKL